MKLAVIAHSGGLDSSTLLLRLLAEGFHITAIGFNYAQKHQIELQKAKQLHRYLSDQGYPLDTHTIDLSDLGTLLHSALTTEGEAIPTGHYQQDNMKQTVVPNRNKIFSSIIQAAALSLANKHQCDVKIAMGIHAGDHTIYPDCRPAFRDADYQAFRQGNWDAEKVTYYTPYLHLSKSEILKDGLQCAKKLKLDWQAVYQRTFTSYAPLQFNNQWYSDYQSAASVERIEAFICNQIIDPISYADSNGPVSWSTAKTYVEKILRQSKGLSEDNLND